MASIPHRAFASWPLACAVVSSLLLRLAPGAAAQSLPLDPPPFRDGVVLVGYHDHVTGRQHGRIAAAVGATDLGTIGARTHVLRVPRGAAIAIVHALRARGEVRYAEPDWIGTADGVPNDPKFSSQWALRNTGGNFGGKKGVAGADEDAVPAWDVTTGSKSIVVGVTDTGIEYTHPDLAANVWFNPGGINGCAIGTHGYNVLNGTCDPMDDDTAYNGHGTHVSGIIGAVGNNARGVAGVNWNTNLLAVKWLNAQATGTTSNLIMALDWLVAARQAGINIRVVNDSATFPGTAYSQALSDEIDLLGANDILFVTAAGNSAQSDDNPSTRRYPCGYMRPNELCVAATDNTDRLWSSSNYGVQTVNLAAPGYSIYSTLRGSSYGYISGCSMSAAEVSGAAALILSTGDRPVSSLRASILNGVDVLASLDDLVQTGGRLNLCNVLPGCTGSTTTTLPTTTSTTSASTTTTPSTTTTTTQPATGIVLVQSNAVEGSAVASLGAPFPSGNAPGNLIVVVVRMSTITQTVTVTDSRGNVYTDAVAQAQTADGHQVHLFYAANVGGGPNTVTATFSGTNNRPWLAIYEYSGLSATNPLDQTARAQGSGSGPSSGATAMTASANELVFAATGLPASYTGTVAAGTGYGLLRQDTGASRAATEAAIVTATGTYTGTFALGAPASWSAVVATFSASPVTSTSTTTTTTSPSTTTTQPPTGIALVQSNAVEGSGVATIASPFPSANTPGNLIIAFIRMSTTTQTVTVSDGRGNVYTDAVAQSQTADGHQVHLFYAANVGGGSNTVTATFSSTNGHPWMAIYEYGGITPTSPLDQTAHAQGSSSAPSSGATGLTASANELVFAATGLPASYTGTVTAGTGYTLQRQDTGTSRAATETTNVAASGAYTGTFTVTIPTNWTAVIATFAASPTVTTTTTTPPSVEAPR